MSDDSGEGTWTFDGKNAQRFGIMLLRCGQALDLAISSYQQFREACACAEETCPTLGELHATRRYIAAMAVQMGIGATLTITFPDEITVFSTVADLSAEQAQRLRGLFRNPDESCLARKDTGCILT